MPKTNPGSTKPTREFTQYLVCAGLCACTMGNVAWPPPFSEVAMCKQ